jgi:class 3 adenylate cyclase
MTATATPDLALEASPAPEQRWKAFQRDLPAGGCELEASILFADVRGSTALAERLSPTAFGELMCSFYRLAGDVVGRAGGVIEKVVGDGVVALFIPGITGPDHARRAIEAAHALLGAIERDADGSPRPPVGVAVHTGRVWLGQVPGPYGRRDVTALGDPVNVAAHLCAAISRASARPPATRRACDTRRTPPPRACRPGRSAAPPS